MPGGFPIVRFVTSPDTTADVLYECNVSVAEKYVGHDGFDAGAPTWSGTPGSVGGTEGYRTLTFTHYVSADPGTAAIAFRDLARVLLADDSWLRIQMTADSPPVWFRTWRSAPGSVSLERVLLKEGGVAAGKYAIPLNLTADPYAIGELIALASGTVNNDPLAGTNPTTLVLPDVLGDAPAPAVISEQWPSSFERVTLTQSVVVDAGYTGPVVLNTPANYSDVGAEVTGNSGFVGGNYRPTVFPATPAYSVFAFLNTPIPIGEYDVFLRWQPVGFTTATSVDLTIAVLGDAGGVVASLTKTVGSGGSVARYLPMGTLRLPVTTAPDDVIDASTLGNTSIQIRAGRTAGVGELRFDCLVLIPTDKNARTLTVRHFGAIVGDPPDILDGDNEVVYNQTSTGILKNATLEVSGGFPTLHPGKTNALHLLGQVEAAPGSYGDDVTWATPIIVSYRPRYLWMQP